MICTGSHQSNATNRARAIIHKVCSDVTDIYKTVENLTSNDLQLTIAYSKNLTIFCESYCKIASHGSCLLGQGHWLHTECIHIFHITNANNCGAVIQAALIQVHIARLGIMRVEATVEFHGYTIGFCGLQFSLQETSGI